MYIYIYIYMYTYIYIYVYIYIYTYNDNRSSSSSSALSSARPKAEVSPSADERERVRARAREGCTRPRGKTRPLTPDRKHGFSSHSQAQAPQIHLHMQVPAIPSLVQARELGCEDTESQSQGHACHLGVGTVVDSASELGPVEATETWRVSDVQVGEDTSRTMYGGEHTSRQYVSQGAVPQGQRSRPSPWTGWEAEALGNALGRSAGFVGDVGKQGVERDWEQFVSKDGNM